MNHMELRDAEAFQKSGRHTYTDIRSLLRAAVTTGSDGVVGPTGVGGINDAIGGVSALVDMLKVTDCTGMTGYKVALMTGDAADAAAITEGSAPTESEPTFDSVTLTPTNYGTVGYVSKEIRKQSPLNYEEKVRESARRALRRKLNAVAANAILASTLNTAHALEADKSATKGSVLFDEKLLSNIILAYGGDEGVEGSACLYLNKADLLTYADLEVDSPYNTYTNLGLIPGPICSPSLSSINAVINAAQTDYYFYVASAALDGTHVFCTNEDEFNEARNEYNAAAGIVG